MLIEVMISAVLVALIVVATFNGFDVVNRTTANQRDRSEANLLAAESQEQLRSNPASALEALIEKGASGHAYTSKVNGTLFTITQTGEDVKGGSGQASTCTATEQTSSSAPNIRITSAVTWPQLGVRPPVKQSSVITPPIGSALEVDVVNGEPATSGIAGVTAVIKYTPTESGSVVTREGTTGAAGCILFGHIRATAVNLEIAEKLNYVTPSGALHVTPTEVSIAPNITTHHQVVYNEGGAIEAEFTVNGEKEYNGKPVTGDTFVVYNELLNPEPHLQLGGTQFTYEVGGEERYTALTAGTPNGSITTTFAPTAKTATGAKYTAGDLFPFPTHEWVAYAGDCGENNAALITKEAVKNGRGLVKAGETTKIQVPLSYLNFSIHKGTLASPSPELLAAAYPVTITNTNCSKAVLPNNAAAFSYEHLQSTLAGGLEDPFQPFGTFELCLQASSVASHERRDRISYDNTTATANPALTLYPEEPSQVETKAAHEKEEAATKKKREEKEKTIKANREAEEAKTKKTREEKEKQTEKERIEKEAPTKAAWEAEEAKNGATKKTDEAARKTKEAEEKTKDEKLVSEEKAKDEAVKKEKISEAEKKAKEAKYKKEREEKEKALKEAREKEEAPMWSALASEEATTKEKRKAQETTQKAAETEETSKRTAAISSESSAKATAENNEKTARTTAENEEKGTEKARVEKEAAEESARSKAGISVESGVLC